MTPDLQPAFRALSDPTRREILRLLGQSEMTIVELSSRFDMTRAAVKKHLIILEQGNLIAARTQGRKRINRLNSDALRPVLDWLNWFDQFWDDRLDALNSALEKDRPDA